jgi:hypothetical protein
MRRVRRLARIGGWTFGCVRRLRSLTMGTARTHNSRQSRVQPACVWSAGRATATIFSVGLFPAISYVRSSENICRTCQRCVRSRACCWPPECPNRQCALVNSARLSYHCIVRQQIWQEFAEDLMPSTAAARPTQHQRRLPESAHWADAPKHTLRKLDGWSRPGH